MISGITPYLHTVHMDAWDNSFTSETATVFVGVQFHRHALKLEGDNGANWFGVVDEDGYALLIRSDLLPENNGGKS